MSEQQLGPCPNCDKRAGELATATGGRLRYYVSCRECIFMTAPARSVGVAVKLWNEAKPATKSSRRKAR